MCKIIARQGKLLCQPTARSKHCPGQGHHRTPAGKRVFSRDCWQKAAGLVPLALPGHGAAPAFPLQHHLFFFQRNRAPFYMRDADLKTLWLGNAPPADGKQRKDSRTIAGSSRRSCHHHRKLREASLHTSHGAAGS